MEGPILRSFAIAIKRSSQFEQQQAASTVAGIYYFAVIFDLFLYPFDNHTVGTETEPAASAQCGTSADWGSWSSCSRAGCEIVFDVCSMRQSMWGKCSRWYSLWLNEQILPSPVEKERGFCIQIWADEWNRNKLVSEITMFSLLHSNHLLLYIHS